MTGTDVHEDLQRFVLGMKGGFFSLRGDCGYAYPLKRGTTVVGWPEWPSGLAPDWWEELQRALPQSLRILTFLPNTILGAGPTDAVMKKLGAFVACRVALDRQWIGDPSIAALDPTEMGLLRDIAYSLGHEYTLCSPQELEATCSLGVGKWLAARQEDGSLVGAILVHGAQSERAWIRRMSVAPNSRRHGYGRLLVTAALAFACTHGFREVTGLVEERVWDWGFYAGMGFKEMNRVSCVLLEAGDV